MVEYLLTYLHDGSKFETDLVRMGFQMAALAFVFTPPHKNIRSVCRYIARAMALTLTIMLCSFVFLPKQETLVPILGGFGLLLLFFIGYPCLFYKKSRDIRLAMILSFTVAGFSVNGLSYCFGTILDQKWPGHTMLFLCMNNCLLVAYCIVVRKYSLDRFLSVLHSGNVLLSVINFIGLATTILTLWINFRVRVMDEFCAVIFFLTYIMSVGVYAATYMLSMENTRLQQMMVERQMDQALQQQVDLTQNSLKNLRKIRHDLKNQYAYMLALLKNKEYENLEDALLEISQQKLRQDGQIDCGNVEVSAILTMEVMKARSKGMNIVTNIVVPPKLPFKNGSLLSIVSNMLDNAMDANERYGVDQEIEICMNLRGEYLYIAVFNYLPANVEKDKLLSLKSSKGNNPEHGLGTRIIQEIAEHYNGYAVFDIQNGMFVTEVMLDMMKGRAYEGDKRGNL